jgi:hypothetical protein
VHLLEHLTIEEPETREWTMMAAITFSSTAGHKVFCDTPTSSASSIEILLPLQRQPR